MSITEVEILNALREAFGQNDDPEGARTIMELREETGLGDKRLRAGIRKLIGKNEAECVFVSRTSIDGRNVAVPAYRRKPAE